MSEEAQETTVPVEKEEDEIKTDVKEEETEETEAVTAEPTETAAADADKAAATDEPPNEEAADSHSPSVQEEEREEPQLQAEGERVSEYSEEEEAEAGDDIIQDIVLDAAQKGGDSSHEQEKLQQHAPPPPFEPVDEKDRSSVHEKLRSFESRRRTSFQAKLESSSLYWRSFRDLLQSSVHETARAERLVLGTAKAHQSYAEAMQASYEDGFLDKKGNVVLNQKKQKRLADQRVIDISPSRKDLPKHLPLVLTEEERKANMLIGIMESQLELARKFGENAREMEQEIASELTQLRTDLEVKVTGINTLGDAILSELEKTETEVSEAWGKKRMRMLVL